MEVVVLRLGHRFVRDDRVTTHVFLTARAFGANKVIYSGQKNEKLENNITKVVSIWGGPFEIKYEKDWRHTIDKWKHEDGEIIHLTIYGLPLLEVLSKIKESTKKKMIIVGGSKVPGIVYKLADWNISLTSQPHSEISALSVFLHEFYEGQELFKTFKNAKQRVIPQIRGKNVSKLL